MAEPAAEYRVIAHTPTGHEVVHEARDKEHAQSLARAMAMFAGRSMPPRAQQRIVGPWQELPV